MFVGLQLQNKNAMGGNPDRVGQAGAGELLINPWARSSGWSNANTASVTGLEAMFLNVAGTAFTNKTELIFCRTNWLQGTQIHINAFGFTQKLGKTGVLGFGVMSQNFGDIQITTTEQPEGGIGTYSPSNTNIGLSYAKVFSNSIYGGINVKWVTESFASVSATGLAFDAGIQYVTGLGKDKKGDKYSDNIKFGISLKNWGPAMSFNGDGLSFKTSPPSGKSYSLTSSLPTEKFELPLLISIGVSYDYKITENHRLTGAGNFTSNSFSKDQYSLGIEYGFKKCFMARVGFTYEEGIFSADTRTTVLTGPCAGFTVEIPFGTSGRTFGLDYSFRNTQPFQGVHSIGARINL